MDELIKFDFEEHIVRVILDGDARPWWIAKDVCEVLEIVNTSQAVERLDEDERSMQNIGRQGDSWTINEPGLYTLIIRSNKPEAKKFKRWITHEVLPAIRQNGYYEVPGKILPYEEFNVFSTGRLRISHKIRLLEIAWRIQQLDHSDRIDLMRMYASLARTEKAKSNNVEDFVESCCRVSPECSVPPPDLYGAYLEWCDAQDDVPELTRLDFYDAVKKATGIGRKKLRRRGTKMVLVGIGLK